MTQEELKQLEALLPNAMGATAEGGDMWPVIVEVPALIRRVRVLTKALEDAAYEFKTQGGGTMESQMAAMIADAEKTLDGAK